MLKRISMKHKIKNTLSFLFHLPLGVAVIFLAILAAAYYMFKDIYIKLRYHLSHTLTQILDSVLIMGGIFLFLWIVKWINDQIDKKQNKNSN